MKQNNNTTRISKTITKKNFPKKNNAAVLCIGSARRHPVRKQQKLCKYL